MWYDGSSIVSVNPTVGTPVLEIAGEDPGSCSGTGGYAAIGVDWFSEACGAGMGFCASSAWLESAPPEGLVNLQGAGSGTCLGKVGDIRRLFSSGTGNSRDCAGLASDFRCSSGTPTGYIWTAGNVRRTASTA